MFYPEVVFVNQPTDPRFINLESQVIGYYKVLGYAGQRETRTGYWNVQCQCGNLNRVSGYDLRKGKIKSCGCLKGAMVSKSRTTHGYSQHGPGVALYRTWASIKRRCYNKNDVSFPYYGGRGIVIFDKWKDDSASFINWMLEHLGPRPGLGYSLDRIENDGNYEPGNLRWANASTQMKNRVRHCPGCRCQEIA